MRGREMYRDREWEIEREREKENKRNVIRNFVQLVQNR